MLKVHFTQLELFLPCGRIAQNNRLLRASLAKDRHSGLETFTSAVACPKVPSLRLRLALCHVSSRLSYYPSLAGKIILYLFPWMIVWARNAREFSLAPSWSVLESLLDLLNPSVREFLLFYGVEGFRLESKPFWEISS